MKSWMMLHGKLVIQSRYDCGLWHSVSQFAHSRDELMSGREPMLGYYQVRIHYCWPKPTKTLHPIRMLPWNSRSWKFAQKKAFWFCYQIFLIWGTEVAAWKCAIEGTSWGGEKKNYVNIFKLQITLVAYLIKLNVTISLECKWKRHHKRIQNKGTRNAGN